MYNTSVQAIGKHKFYTLFLDTLGFSTAIDSTVCHNNIKTVLIKQNRAYDFFLLEFGLNIVQKWKKKQFLTNFNRIMHKIEEKKR